MKLNHKAFTLIELIIVVVIVSLVAAAVFVSVNPGKRLGDTKDAQRWSDVTAIKKAVDTYTADNAQLPSDFNISSINIGDKVVLCSSASQLTCDGQTNNCLVVDDGSFLNTYLPNLPIDPDKADNTDTGYYITKTTGDLISFGACEDYENDDDVQLHGRSKMPTWTCGDALTDNRDGKTYNTVEIGTQCWMAESLNVGTRINVAVDQSDNSTLEKFCYDDNEANCTSDGGIYQWSETMNYTASCNGAGASQPVCSSPVQGNCPNGWHIPSHYETVLLKRTICTTGSCVTDFPYDESTTGYRGTDEGTKLKVGGSSGMEIILAGASAAEMFALRGSIGAFWSSLESGASAWNAGAVSFDPRSTISIDAKLNGYSVRCIQD